MAKQTSFKDEGVNFESLGISNQVQEPDRMQLDARGAMQITRIRFDYHTKYWNDKSKTGTPIIKFDGFDWTTGERVKYFTLSSVLYKTFTDLMLKVGVTIQKDDQGNEWSILKNAVNVGGFEKVGVNKYIKIVPFVKE